MKQRSRSFLLVLLTLGVGLSACKKDPAVEPDPVTPQAPTGVVKLTVVPEWEGAPMQRFTEYRNFMDYRVNVELLKLYLGEVRLANGGVEKALSDVLYFDLGDGPVSQTWRLDTGTWMGMKAGLGVPSLLNHADPAEFGPSHPLNVSNGTHWGWLTGYRFVIFEGRYDPDPSSTDPLISSYSLHPGMDTCYTALELWPSEGLQVRQGDTAYVTIRFAVDEFFHSTNNEIDLLTENTAHATNLPLALKVMDNVVRSISVD